MSIKFKFLLQKGILFIMYIQYNYKKSLRLIKNLSIIMPYYNSTIITKYKILDKSTIKPRRLNQKVRKVIFHLRLNI
jgi:hypothetical protein